MTELPDTDRGNGGRPRVRTAHVAAFSLVAFVAVPLLLVAFFGDSNLHSRMEQWYALHISLQSVDPGRIAIDDPEADTKLIASYLEPGPGRLDRAKEFHDMWRNDRDWAIRDGDLKKFEIDQNGQQAEIVLDLVMDTANETSTTYREVRERSIWTKIDGAWYLSTIDSETTDTYTRKRPGVIRP